MIPALAARTVAQCSHVVAGPWTTTNPVWQAACRVCVEAALREYHEAAVKAACRLCQDGHAPEPDRLRDGSAYHLGAYTGHAVERCYATALRALADAPAPERTP